MMKVRECVERLVSVTGCVGTLLIVGVALLAVRDVKACSSCSCSRSVRCGHGDCRVRVAHETCDGEGGNWYWMRSAEQEARIVASLYNRYCMRCHGVDGRGVWDMPDVPDFTNARWQASRSDAQLARLILEGRGAVMPAFRGTLALEEAWAMGRYLRSFAPGSESRVPDDAKAAKTTADPQGPKPTSLILLPQPSAQLKR